MDELLSKYACGTANNEEKAVVRNYLAEDMNHLQKMIELMRSIAMGELNLSSDSDMLSPKRLSEMHMVPQFAKMVDSAILGNVSVQSAFPSMLDVLEDMILNNNVD